MVKNLIIVSLSRNLVPRLESVTKIMGKTAVWTILCFSPLPRRNNVEEQQAKLASRNVIGSQHCIGGEGEFQTLFLKFP